MTVPFREEFHQVCDSASLSPHPPPFIKSVIFLSSKLGMLQRNCELDGTSVYMPNT